MFIIPDVYIHVRALYGKNMTFCFPSMTRVDTIDEYNTFYSSAQHLSREAMVHAIAQLGTIQETFPNHVFTYEDTNGFIPIATFSTETNTYQVTLEYMIQEIFYDQVTPIPTPNIHASDEEKKRYWSLCIRAFLIGNDTHF